MPLQDLLVAPAPVDAVALLDRLDHPVWIFDIDRSRVHWANREAVAMWQASSLQALCARDMAQGMSVAVSRRLRQYQADFQQSAARFGEQWTLYPGGVPVTMWVDFSGWPLADGRMAMLCSARRTGAEATPPDSLRSVDALLHTEVMTTLYSRAGRALYRNPTSRASVAPGADRLGTRLTDREDLRDLVTALQARGEAKLITRVRTAGGDRWHDLSARMCRDPATGRRALLVTEIDVSGLKQAQAQAQYLADHDQLTGLPNRNQVLKTFAQALRACRLRGDEAALVFIDLDHFKRVNDSLGHAVGDELLVQLARRLNDARRPGECVARLGGDEFLLMLPLRDVVATAMARADELVALIAQPVVLPQTELRVTPSIGISLFPQDGEDLDTLMRHADLAMYGAKAAGRGTAMRFRPEMTAAAQSRLALEVELRRALAQGQIGVHYQPRVEVASGRIVGAEALVRWRHPERGMIPPDVFISVCEDCGLIGELGAMVLEKACAQQVAWAAAGRVLTVSVNLSPRQFFAADLVAEIRDILTRTGCSPAAIELEITESVLLGHDDRTVTALEALGQMGLRIAIDDFGTGYSNLAYLHRYPVDTLKIDRSFIRALSERPAITEMIVTMCRMLGVTMVAEGVELAEQLDWLRGHAVHEYQGWLFGPAVAPEEFERRWMAAPAAVQ
ncbi:MAG: hypothetical protein QG612_880 [Pseudomonadota bacterium]|nr:hypothetical protein [Pseudomonadota bacterium]